MKLANRERVDGTRVTIGRRVYYVDGKAKISPRYTAEYRDLDGRQVSRSLGTTSKAQARRMALQIQQELESGIQSAPDTNVKIQHLIEAYFFAVQAKGLAPKTEWKYRADLAKLREYCTSVRIVHARRFGPEDLFRYRRWLYEQGYADKTVQGAVTLAKQLFKWAWRRGMLKEYRLAGTSFPKARARPQPCFTSAQVDQLIEVAEGEEKAAFALMGYAGLRIGEVEQLRWEDIHRGRGRLTMIHVRRGGSTGSTKDKDDRFVPVHPKVAVLLEPIKKDAGPVLRTITERRLLARLKRLCQMCGFDDPQQYKLHSFRHHFASLCANHRVAYRKALAWLGHSSSQMLDLYYHLHDEDSQRAMQALAEASEAVSPIEAGLPIRTAGTSLTEANEGISPAPEMASPREGSLKATGESKIEKPTQLPELQELTETLASGPERAGFEPAVPLLWGTHAFQACPFSRSGTSPFVERPLSGRSR